MESHRADDNRNERLPQQQDYRPHLTHGVPKEFQGMNYEQKRETYQNTNSYGTDRQYRSKDEGGRSR